MPEDSHAAGASLTERFARQASERGYESDGAQLAALARLQALRSRLLAEREPNAFQRLAARLGLTRPLELERGASGIYLYGAVGRGKTMLMDLFYDSLGLPPSQRRRLHFHHFMREVHARLRLMQRRRAPLQSLARELAAELRVLCLDELYVNDIADAMILGTLFEALLRHGLQLVITSNLAPQQLYRDGLQRSRFLPAIALLERALEQCPLGDGADYRLRQLQRLPIYLDSHAPDSEAQMLRLFEELSGGAGSRGVELQILGRSVPTLRCRSDVVWFEFEVLCASARSQNDYIELAQEYRCVLLSHVPQFDAPDEDDAARRFIALVDEFYDQCTKLVISAAATPSQLYRQGRLHAEFQRTASRLVEMQTAGYLGRSRRSSSHG